MKERKATEIVKENITKDENKSDEVKKDNAMCEIIVALHHFIRVKIIILDHKIYRKIDEVSNKKNAD